MPYWRMESLNERAKHALEPIEARLAEIAASTMSQVVSKPVSATTTHMDRCHSADIAQKLGGASLSIKQDKQTDLMLVLTPTGANRLVSIMMHPRAGAEGIQQ
jgi:chemotaxis protein CheY-P-specific phosphatase CheC